MTKILVIEDELAVRANIVELLESEEFDVISAENGFLGALWAQEFLPDLILCDIMMPELNGYDILNALRQNPLTATIPFIFLTAFGDKTDVRYGMELGADDYLTKPFTRAELLGAIKTQMAKYQVVRRQQTALAQRSEELQQQVKELQQYKQLSNVLPKLNMAIYILKNLQQGKERGREACAVRNRCLEVLQQACSEELAMLNQMPNIRNFLTPENAQLLSQLNLIKQKETGG